MMNGTEKMNLHAYHDSTTYTYKDEYRQGALSPNLPIQLASNQGGEEPQP